MKTCTEDSCTGRRVGRKLCAKHYQRLMKHGTTAARIVPTASERFWSKVDKTADCWNWMAATYSNGYGHFGLSAERGAIAHRYAWEELVGPIPEGLLLDHECHNRRCVNPGHLRHATQKQNLENVGGLRSDNRSGVRGVSRRSDGKSWRARVYHNGAEHNLGSFASLADAEVAATAARNQLFTHNNLDRKSAK
jgi:hypothetical protein